MFEELNFLNHWLQSKDIYFAKKQGIDKSYFFVLKDVFEYIEEFIGKFNSLPSLELVATDFDDFRVVDLDPLQYVVNELRESKAYTEYRPIITTNAQLVNQGKTLEAIANMQEITKKHLESQARAFYRAESTLDYMNTNFLNEINLNKTTPRVSTGFKCIDDTLGGGLYTGLYAIGAEPTVGKTAFLLQIADHLAKNGNDVLFFTLEMSKRELICRSIARELYDPKTRPELANSIGDVLFGRVPDSSLNKALEAYRGYCNNIYFIEGNFGTTIDTIQRNVRNHVTATGKKPVVMIDYLQIIQPQKDSKSTERQVIDANIIGLKQLSRDLDIPVLVISSFNRASYDKMTFACFKESGCIEYSADVVIGMGYKKSKEYDDSYWKEQDERAINVTFLKNRLGVAYSEHSFWFIPKTSYYEQTNGFDDVRRF